MAAAAPDRRLKLLGRPCRSGNDMQEIGRPLSEVMPAGMSDAGVVVALTLEGLEWVWAPRRPARCGRMQPRPPGQLDWRDGFSFMAMTVLRKAQRLVGIDLSPTMPRNNLTISSCAAYLTEMPASQGETDAADVTLTLDSATSVLATLFHRVESAPTGTESGVS